jgi:hypothetical protein
MLTSLETRFGLFATVDHPISGMPAILSEQRRGLEAWENVRDGDISGPIPSRGLYRQYRIKLFVAQ